MNNLLEDKNWSSYEDKNLESAFCHTMRLKHLIEEKYGYESVEMAHCLRQLGQIHYSMKLPEKEFEETYGAFDSPISFYDYFVKLASPFYWLQQNLHHSLYFFQEGYDLLKKVKGTYAYETQEYKRLYIDFISWKTVTAHFTQTLWILIAHFPLMAIMVPVISGLHWKSLGAALTILASVIAWRTVSTFFYFFMTQRHYKRTIQ